MACVLFRGVVVCDNSSGMCAAYVVIMLCVVIVACSGSGCKSMVWYVCSGEVVCGGVCCGSGGMCAVMVVCTCTK